MAEVLLDTNSPIKHKVFWRGEVRDADDTPTVRVYDITEDPAISPAINKNEILTTLTPTKVETDIGVYEVYLPYALTKRQRSFLFVWEYFVEEELFQKEHKIYVTTPYTDIAQAIDSIGLGADPSDPNYKTWAEITEAERYARKTIEAYTGQLFYLYNDVHVVYGSGSDILPLPYRIEELHELYQNDILLVDRLNEIENWGYSLDISPTNYGLKVNRATMLDNTVYVANGMVPPTINDSNGGAFSNGTSYTVQGVYGWSEVPDEVDIACIELMKDYFSKDKVWRNKYLKNVSAFDWKFEYNSATYSGTGNVYVDQLLLPYVLSQATVI